MKKHLLSMMAIGLIASSVYGQNRPATTSAPADTTRRPAGAPGAAGRAQPKPYKSVITDKAVTQKGMITSHKVDDRFYFELPNEVLGRDILVVNRISKAGAEVRAASGYAGDQIGGGVIRFEKGPNNRIFMRKVSFNTYSPDSTKSMYQAVQRSNIQAIAAAFNVAAYSDDKTATVVDMTDYLNTDSELFYFSSPQNKQRFRLGAQISDRSYVESVRSFPTNVEISTIKTYGLLPAPNPFTGAPASGGGAPVGSQTVQLNTSLVLLPAKPMQSRYFDPRVGFFTVGYTDFDLNPQGIKEVSLVKRWRLEPKPEDVAKYKRGELVEPQKPIVFYIDPATPKKWIPYLIAGVNDWQKAFEKAGFKNAIIGKMAPTPKEDPSWSLDDARNSAIVYKPSEIANASGPSISDPRSGEIMESHINWFHNVQKLVHDWYMIQASAIDPRARKMTFDDELMGDLIRFVSSHEVGHTLGLRHNYGSSSTVPVENLRNKQWVEEHGHTPSIMDYARFNYVAQPGDGITKKGIYPRIGDYDLWAIEWGYRWYPEAKTPDEEVAMLNKLTIDKLKNPRNWFGTETNPDDPHSQNEDLGDNAMKASEYGIQNLKYILNNLNTWTKEPNDGYDNLDNMYGQLTGQFGRYMGHVAKNIGGIYEVPKTVEQSGTIYVRTPAETQREAMAFLDRQLFTTPSWLLNKDVLDNTGRDPLLTVSRLQDATLNRLLGRSTLSKLVSAEAADGANAYKITDMFNALQGSIFKELNSGGATDVYRRNLQKSYVEKLTAMLKPAPTTTTQGGGGGGGSSQAATRVDVNQSDVISVVKAQLRQLDSSIKTALPSVSDSMSKYHYQDISERIQNALDPK